MPTSPLTATPAHKQEIYAALLRLPFPAFVRCCADLMTALGYEDVRAILRGSKKAKNHSGGIDIEAWARVGTVRRPVIAQVKQLPRTERVARRYLDELRGAALRVGATEALLLTTGTFSYVIQDQVRRQQQAIGSGSLPLVPVQCFDGDALTDLLITHGIGSRNLGNAWQVHGGYFADLSKRYAGKSLANTVPPVRRKSLPARDSKYPGVPGRVTQISIRFCIPKNAANK